jgi:hypothetical protein
MASAGLLRSLRKQPRRGHQPGSLEKITGRMVLQERSNAAVHGSNPFVCPSGLEAGVILQGKSPRLARGFEVTQFQLPLGEGAAMPDPGTAIDTLPEPVRLFHGLDRSRNVA